jgi:diguanylate cyclase (GGDEF)-like protein/PAS domain S-box-containing protein
VTAGTPPTRWFLRGAAGSAILGACYLAWLLSDAGSRSTEAVVSDLVFVVAPLLAAVACWRARRRDPAGPTGWGWIGLGCLVWAGGSVVFATYQFVLGEVAPMPSFADLGYIGYAVPVGIGVVGFGRTPGTSWARWRSVLDSAVIAGALLLTSAVWVLDPVLDATSMTPARWAALGYPLADVLIASIVLARWVLLPDVRLLVWLPLSVGLLCLAVTDSVYVALSYRGAFHPGTGLDVGWFWAFALIALAASAPASGGWPAALASRVQAGGYARQVVPAAATGLAMLSFLAVPDALDQHHRWWLLLPVLACVVARGVAVAGEQTAVARGLSDAVDRRTAELRHREQWWQDIVANLSDVVIVLDQEGAVVYCSPAVDSALGHMPMLLSAELLMTQVHPEDEAKVMATIVPVLTDGGRPHGSVECRIKRSDESYGWFEVQATGQLHERALAGAVLTLHDVSERRELTTRLLHQAHHDALTGLPNRSLLTTRVQEALEHRDARPFGLLLLDLDDFKVINDQHGHAAGDRVLTVIGQRLTQLVRAGDTVARLGGDEFAHLVHGTAADLRAVADRLVQAIEEEITDGDRRFQVRSSIGIVVAGPGEAESSQSLLSHADIALYEAKARGKGGIVLIEGATRDDAAKQVALREQVAHPVLEQFRVVYQPIVDLTTGEMRGVESLLRWDHPEVGPVPPDVFIPMAEHGGSIRALGWYVLGEACRQLAAWQSDLAPGRRLAVGVNVSVLQLDEPGFAGRLAALVASHGVDPDQIVVELTEQALAVDFETAVQVVGELRAIGVSVAVDDYGTGYSSLRYLDRFDADVLKIDRSFVANVAHSPHTQKIVRSVLQMSQALDLQSIAEGIETTEQLAAVQALGCDLGQGYLFSRPVPAEGITALLADPDHFVVALLEASLVQSLDPTVG